MIGVGDNIGVRTAPEFIFSIFCIPVGAYFKGGLTPHNFLISSFDRAAHKAPVRPRSVATTPPA